MNVTAEAPITDALVEEFQNDGVAVVRGVFTDWIDPLREGVERNMQDPGPYTKGYTPEGGSGRFFGDYCNWQRIPEYDDFVRNSPAGAIAGRLMGSRHARFFHEHVLVKEPGTREATPWHVLLSCCCCGCSTIEIEVADRGGGSQGHRRDGGAGAPPPRTHQAVIAARTISTPIHTRINRDFGWRAVTSAGS